MLLRRLGLAVLLATMAIVPLVVSPVGEFAVDDDWTYAQAVQRLVETGAYHRSAWIDTAFVAQAWWGAAISKLLGFSLTGLRLGTLVLAAVALVVVLLAYADPRDVGVEVRFADIWQAATLADLVGVALKETALASLLLGLSVAPAVFALWLPRGWRVWLGRRGWRTWQYGLASLLLLALAGLLAYRASAATDWLTALSPLFGNTLSSSGLTVSGLHPRAISVDTTTLAVLVGAALLGVAGLVLAVVELAGQVTGRPHPPTPSPLRWRGGDRQSSPPLHRNGEGVGGWGFPLALRLLAIAAGGILVLMLGYGPVGGPVNGLYDRYLLPVLPGLLAIGAYASRDRRAALPVLLAAVLLFAGWSVSWQHEYMARQTAVWTVAQTMVAAGIPAAEIDAGYEWNGWSRGDAVVERARETALATGEPRRFVQLVVDGIDAPHAGTSGSRRPERAGSAAPGRPG